MKNAVYVNRTITPTDQAVIPIYDHEFVYGEGVYETLRTYNRVPFLYDRHMQRLRASAAALQLNVPFDNDTMQTWIEDTITVTRRQPKKLNETYIRILLTHGVGELTYDPKATPTPSLVIIVKPFDEPPTRVFKDGIRITLVSILRNHPGSVNPIIKANNLLNNTMTMQETLRHGSEEALLLNYRGEISEYAQSNFFLMRDGVALTPPSTAGLLEELTRGFLFEVGRDINMRVKKATLRPKNLGTTNEAFITGSTRELTPIVRISDQTIGNGHPGPMTHKLLDAFRKKALDLSTQAPIAATD